ncbi:Nup133 N terminal like-domain-containing protein [Mycotypha africana]|uniref:Nup133 N terminal like-domain-containing protein n=1 Tax=Mycotypha africana TaxID=64632 RepID=UPI0023000758|nr:Nup133 N terminal like-domain-containing protein [Mycotypha africana]KAI8983994.1 Nup133 N terminal like-domain-containing protein [Mycotypha africana]
MNDLHPSKPSAERLESTMNTAKHIEQVIARDQEQVDLATLLPSGPSSNYMAPLLSAHDEFKLTNEIRIPSRLTNRVTGAQCYTKCGVFPEINRAWIAIDNNLYIWSLTDANEVYEYSDQDQIIVNCALVKPRPNIFQDHIKYLLVVSTPLQVILLAVEVNEAPMRINLYATNLQVSSDDEQMKHIEGTDDGRIFMIGRRGSLYEAYYDDSWAGKQLKLINKTSRFLDAILPTYTPRFLRPEAAQPIKSMAIDNERKVLYLLYENNAIEVVYLGGSFRSFRSIHKHVTIADNAIQMCRQHSKIFNASDFIIDSIHIVSEKESKKAHLMAITTAGFRLYFTHRKDSFRYTPPNISISTTTTNVSLEPNTLELGFIRIPPPEPPRSAGDYALMYTNTYYDCGIAISINPKNEEFNTIRITATAAKKPASMPTPGQPQSNTSSSLQPYLETDIALDLKARTVVTVTEDNRERYGKHYLKEISQQLADPPRRFIILTTEAVLFYTKLRPVDILHDIIVETRGQPLAVNAKAIQAFFERYGQVEACAMCLSIVCASDIYEVVAKASELFFEFGGVPTASVSTQITGNHLGRVIGQTDVTYSGKHDGFLLYLARIMSPAWKLKAFIDCGDNITAQKLFTQAQSTLFNTQMNLKKLKAFVESNPNFYDTNDLSDTKIQLNRNTVLLELAEQKSVHENYLLLIQSIEAIAFIQFVLDSNVQQISSDYLTPDQQKNVQDLDLNTILTNPKGRELTRELVIAAIVKYASSHNHAGFDIVSRHLEKFCSSFFGQSDMLFFKGIEYVRQALCEETDYEMGYSLKQSLYHLKMTADTITDQKLNAIGDVYLKCAFHAGAIELALERARRVDPQNQGLIAYKSMHSRNSDIPTSGTPDESSHRFLDARAQSYQFIFTVLNDADLIKLHNRVPEGRLPIADINLYIKNLYDTAFQSDDELFHYCLYDWFQQKNRLDELIPLNSPHLIPYFMTYVKDRKIGLDFLWRYYRIHSNYIEAARCLEELASLPDPRITQSLRVEYMAHALVNVRCVEVQPPNIDLAAYTQQLEQQLEEIRTRKNE